MSVEVQCSEHKHYRSSFVANVLVHFWLPLKNQSCVFVLNKIAWCSIHRRDQNLDMRHCPILQCHQVILRKPLRLELAAVTLHLRSQTHVPNLGGNLISASPTFWLRFHQPLCNPARRIYDSSAESLCFSHMWTRVCALCSLHAPSCYLSLKKEIINPRIQYYVRVSGTTWVYL